MLYVTAFISGMSIGVLIVLYVLATLDKTGLN